VTIIYMASSIIGGVVTASMFGQHDLLTGILSVPVGGSLVTAAAALLLMFYPSSRKPEAVPPGVIWC
jgi:hypothetical protein